MKEEIKFYIERADKFIKNAKFNYENKDYDLAMFHIEQAMQLLIKAKIMDLKGYFERTHNLRKLLADLKDIEKEEIEEFLENYKTELRNLERAYITSRYFFEEFFKEEVEKSFEAFDKLKKILWKE